MNKKIRRNVLKGLTVAVPVAWTRPVVNSMVLPAHATLSGEEYFGQDLLQVVSTDSGDHTWIEQLADIAVPEAHADSFIPAGCAVVQGDLVEVTYHNRKNTRRWNGILDRNGSEGTLTEILTTCSGDGGCGKTTAARILAIAEGSYVRVSVDQCKRGETYVFDIPGGATCNLPALSDGGSCF